VAELGHFETLLASVGILRSRIKHDKTDEVVLWLPFKFEFKSNIS